ncbi:hypothetical protein OFB63_30750, partial [Escherichia coli]|nr:hypothetical protein [Escherichia coli]
LDRAEDATAETIEAWISEWENSSAKYSPDLRIEAWLFKVCFRIRISHWRKQRKVLTPGDESLFPDPPDSSPTPEETVINEAFLSSLEECVNE